MENSIVLNQNNGEIILYQPDNSIRLEVRIQGETVWLTQAQMSLLFQSTKQNISLHINNIFREGELDKVSVVKDFLTTAADGKNYHTLYYNLDVIISVGYRVKSIRGTQFRQWANSVLKDYLLRGYAINQRIERLEQRVTRTEEQIGLFVRTALPPVEGVFYDGQVFDAYTFVADLIRSAHERIVLIDNYVDDSVFFCQLKNFAKGRNFLPVTPGFTTRYALGLLYCCFYVPYFRGSRVPSSGQVSPVPRGGWGGHSLHGLRPCLCSSRPYGPYFALTLRSEAERMDGT